MNSEYELSAIPCLENEAQYKGQLKGILFVAKSMTDKMQWFAVNCGQFEESFGQIVPRGLAENIVSALSDGEEVTFPGHYSKTQFAGGFHQPQPRFRTSF